MSEEEADSLCWGCVYYPPNLPRHAYAEADWQMLQSLSCAFEYQPGSADCLGSRKTSCSLLDLETMGGQIPGARRNTEGGES